MSQIAWAVRYVLQCVSDSSGCNGDGSCKDKIWDAMCLRPPEHLTRRHPGPCVWKTMGLEDQSSAGQDDPKEAILYLEVQGVPIVEPLFWR